MQKDKNELKNGIETCWHPSGKKSTEGLWVDGSKQGKWLEWYENGQLKSEESFKNNIWHGDHIYWYENGQKMRESKDVDGLYEGRWISWHENGQKKAEQNFKDGEMIYHITRWFENGHKRAGFFREKGMRLILALSAFQRIIADESYFNLLIL